MILKSMHLKHLPQLAHNLLTDHLGSTSITADGASGAKLSELRYASQPATTGLRFTGQRAEGIGLYEYGARWYDAYLNRWTSPDSIIPLENQGVQAWDRYAYANNNPVRFNDPSGHVCNDPEAPTRRCDGGPNRNYVGSNTKLKPHFDANLGGNNENNTVKESSLEKDEQRKPPSVAGIVIGGVITVIGVAGFALGIGVAAEDPPIGLLLAGGSLVVAVFGAEIVYRSLGDLRPPSWPDSLPNWILNIEGLKQKK
jgi:RHS repeat-associated protein